MFMNLKRLKTNKVPSSLGGQIVIQTIYEARQTINKTEEIELLYKNRKQGT